MKHILLPLLLLFALNARAQEILKGDNWQMNITAEGNLSTIVFKNDTIPFFKSGKWAGPSFYLKELEELTGKWIKQDKYRYTTEIDGVACELRYVSHKGLPSVQVTVRNNRYVPFQPEKAGLKLGIDTYMDKYPDWFGKYFPTLMRNERTHFYGYLQSPAQNVVAVVSEQPVASWSVDYNLGYQDPAPHWFWGHRIESLNIDFMNQLPLPDHNPQNLYQLKQGESKSWILSFVDVGKLENLEEAVSVKFDIPLFDIPVTACNPGEKISFRVFGSSPDVRLVNDKGENLNVFKTSVAANVTSVEVMLPQVGLYTVTATVGDKVSEAVLSANNTWRWTLENAREAALRYHQKPTSHAESYYGFYSAYIARKLFPDAELDEKVDDRFNLVFNKLNDSVLIQPLYHKSRIQNTSTFIGILVDKYEASGDISDLKKAEKLADWLMNNYQRKDGAYFNHGTVYTSVIYIAKSMLELAIVEKELGKTDKYWHKAYLRHYNSAKRAIDQLVESQGDFETEGELTFEDGMISCSALQIGMFALLQDNAKQRNHYKNAMLEILRSHNCITQLKVPDARRRQGTMRYWEAQYDVQMLPNMFNSPHGWSGWRAYATYYAYLLTGDEEWLTQTFNAMGAFGNLIDYKTGELRWAFVIDPFLKVEQTSEPDPAHETFDDVTLGNPHPRLYATRHFTIGEQYINMVSDWQTVNTQDNDVHELFKCMGETVLTNAFIVEQPDGTIKGYNCKVKVDGDLIEVTSDEAQIVNLHCNTKRNIKVSFNGSIKSLKSNHLGWF